MGDYQAEETATPGTVIEGQSRREDDPIAAFNPTLSESGYCRSLANWQCTVERTEECPTAEPVFVETTVLALGLTAFAGMAGLGGAAMAYKGYKSMQARREWSKFNASKKSMQWNDKENTLYEGGVEDAVNPLYDTHADTGGATTQLGEI